MNYHNRIDFRALDIIVQAIDNATLPELKQAITDCKEWGNNLSVKSSKRKIWKSLTTLLQRELK